MINKRQNYSIGKDISVVFLDKDGTIMDGHHYWIKMIKLRGKLLLEFLQLSDDAKLRRKIESTLGIDHDNNKMKNNGPVGVMPKEFNINVLRSELSKIGHELTISNIEDIFVKADLVSSMSIEKYIKPLPGVREFLVNCYKRSITVAILSNDTSKRCELAIKVLGFDQQIKYVFGGEVINKSKKSGHLAKFAMDKIGIKSDKVLNVGDHPNDIAMGINAKINKNVGVLTGLSRLESFSDINCSIIENFNNFTFCND